MKKELLAAVDLGTSYVKSGVYNLDGECIAGASEAVKNERPSPGIFIQHGEELVDSVIRCIRKIAEQIPERMLLQDRWQDLWEWIRTGMT